jgi:hypothetical protein
MRSRSPTRVSPGKEALNEAIDVAVVEDETRSVGVSDL